MRLSVIKHVARFIQQNDEDYVVETLETLENLIEAPGIKDEELDLIGNLLSDLSGAIEVARAIRAGQAEKDALSGFMSRVVGSIDKS